MKQKFIRVPFAQDGDVTDITIAPNHDGSVSYTEGWGDDYEKDLTTDAHAKVVEREVMNTLFHDITDNISHYQRRSFPEWVTPADNGGQAYPYARQAVVLYNNNLFVSLTDNNTSIPGVDESEWQPFIYQRASKEQAITGKDRNTLITPETLLCGLSNFQQVLKPYLLPIGSIIAWPGTIPPDGWLELNGAGFDETLYPDLAKLFPAGVLPDFRGEFIRGWDHGRDIDAERNILSWQADEIRSHRHSYYDNTGRGGGAGPAINQGMGQKFTDYTGGNETRPRNIAVMYIIKTDLASQEQGDVPTNLIVSPQSINAGIGSKKQINTTILPESVADRFPVTYKSSDASVCTVSDTGLVELVGVGSAAIIASVSTGLAATVNVVSNILLTNIKLPAISDLTAGERLTIAYTGIPTNYTEPLIFNSSNSNVATINNEGELIAVSAGTAVLTVTGSVSGKTSNVTVKVQAAQYVETYLTISENLSDLEDIEQARENLGLGDLAMLDTITAGDVGAVPVADEAIPSGKNLNNIMIAGQYFQNISSNAMDTLNYPENVAGVLIVYKTGIDNGCRQVYMPYNSTAEYRRYAYGSPLTWSTWETY